MEELFKYFLPLIVPFVVGAWKKFISKMPKWTYPILSGFLGMIIILIEEILRGITVETASLVNGAIAGLAGSGIYDIKKNFSEPV